MTAPSPSLPDLAQPLTPPDAQWLGALRSIFRCDATALLKYEEGRLIPLQTAGLAPQVMEMSFPLDAHPRLQGLRGAQAPLLYREGDARPDPYDGLVLGAEIDRDHVHSCVVCPLTIDGELIGALTLDSVQPGCFGEADLWTLSAFAALAAAALHRPAPRAPLSPLASPASAPLSGDGALMARLRHDLDAVARTDLTVLIQGETGVGKELVARAIHARSRRAAQPLVYINCAALPEGAANAALFGAATDPSGPARPHIGHFERADGATLFLDEVGDLPLSIQSRLLRALQHGELQRVGDERPLQVNVRVLASTQRDLQREIQQGRFRADLFHRLHQYPLRVPSLRERPEDLLPLAQLYLERAQAQLHLPPARLSEPACALLRAHSWPGNLRELEHAITSAAIRAAHGATSAPHAILPAHLTLQPLHPPAAPSPSLPAPEKGLLEAVDDFQRALIRDTVQRNGGNWARAARLLKMDRSNLHRLATRLGLK
jgi:anaerobic nitric oxide reductase transcription regulator